MTKKGLIRGPKRSRKIANDTIEDDDPDFTKKAFEPIPFLLEYSPRELVIPSNGELEIQIKNPTNEKQLVFYELDSFFFKSKKDYGLLASGELMTLKIETREEWDEEEFNKHKTEKPEGCLMFSHRKENMETMPKPEEFEKILKDKSKEWAKKQEPLVIKKEISKLKQIKEKWEMKKNEKEKSEVKKVEMTQEIKKPTSEVKPIEEPIDERKKRNPCCVIL